MTTRNECCRFLFDGPQANPISAPSPLNHQSLSSVKPPSTIIAWPVGFFSMNSWLENFAYRTSIGADTFLISAALALVIALGTICYQVTKASRANPVKALRYE